MSLVVCTTHGALGSKPSPSESGHRPTSKHSCQPVTRVSTRLSRPERHRTQYPCHIAVSLPGAAQKRSAEAARTCLLSDVVMPLQEAVWREVRCHLCFPSCSFSVQV